MYKSYNQNGVASNVQLGINGDKLHSLGGRIKATDKNDVLVPVAVGAPQSGNDAVTLDYLKMKADIRVMGAIANLDTLPTSGQLTNIYYDQAGDQLVYGGKNDAGDANVWDVIDVDKDFMILAVVEIQKADTSVFFQADRLYQYDTVTSDWIDHGQAPATDMTGVAKKAQHTFTFADFNAQTNWADWYDNSVLIKISVKVKTAFVGAPLSEIYMDYNSGNIDGFVDFATTGIYDFAVPEWDTGSNYIEVLSEYSNLTAGEVDVMIEYYGA